MYYIYKNYILMKIFYLLTVLTIFSSCSGAVDEEVEVIDPNDNWGEITTQTPSYFTTSDVSTDHLDLVKEYYSLGSTNWGNYGPLEWWVIGFSESAAAALDITYCNRRDEVGSNTNNCVNRSYDFKEYAKNGSAGLNTRRNTGEKWSGFIITMASKHPSPNEDDYKQILLHEYFHVYQNAHIFSKIESERDSRKQINPWWMEGGAEYMSQLLYSQQPGVGSERLKERMTWKMDSKSRLTSGEKINTIPYGDRGDIAYDLGAWFIAYLIDRTTLETYKTDFFKDLNDLGFEGSFTEHFGDSSTVLLADFHNNFLNQPLRDQLKIIP
jgi:hypothetical protein